LIAVKAFVISSRLEIITSAPSMCEVFVHGMCRTEYLTPSEGERRMNEEDREMCREGSKLLVLTMMSSPSLQHDQKAVHVTANMDTSNALERSSPRKSACICSSVTGGQRGHFDDSGTTLARPAEAERRML